MRKIRVSIKCILYLACGLAVSSTKVSAVSIYNMPDTIKGIENTVFEQTKDDTKSIMYSLHDTAILYDKTNTSAILQTVHTGDTVPVLEKYDLFYKVLTTKGKIGYISTNQLTEYKDDVFFKVNETKYAMDNTECHQTRDLNSKIYTVLNLNDEVSVIGRNDIGTVQVKINNDVCYVDGTKLMDSVYKPKHFQQEYPLWNGPVLSASKGSVLGPSGKETYYNLNMDSIINIMSAFTSGNYWIRDDGVKMLGDYVMVAADYNIRPRGTILETSLGTGIVCDTGGFASSNPTQLDIAVSW